MTQTTKINIQNLDLVRGVSFWYRTVSLILCGWHYLQRYSSEQENNFSKDLCFKLPLSLNNYAIKIFKLSSKMRPIAYNQISNFSNEVLLRVRHLNSKKQHFSTDNLKSLLHNNLGTMVTSSKALSRKNSPVHCCTSEDNATHLEI